MTETSMHSADSVSHALASMWAHRRAGHVRQTNKKTQRYITGHALACVRRQSQNSHHDHSCIRDDLGMAQVSLHPPPHTVLNLARNHVRQWYRIRHRMPPMQAPITALALRQVTVCRCRPCAGAERQNKRPDATPASKSEPAACKGGNQAEGEPPAADAQSSTRSRLSHATASAMPTRKARGSDSRRKVQITATAGYMPAHSSATQPVRPQATASWKIAAPKLELAARKASVVATLMQPKRQSIGAGGTASSRACHRRMLPNTFAMIAARTTKRRSVQ